MYFRKAHWRKYTLYSHLADRNIFTRLADILSSSMTGMYDNGGVDLFNIFLHDDAISAGRHHTTGHNAGTLSGFNLAAERLTCKYSSDYL